MKIRSKFYAILCVGVLLGTTGCYRDELASFQKQIDDFKKTSVDELDKRVKSVEEQIVQINQTIKDLEEVKKELQSKIDAATELIAELSKDVEKNSGDISILNNSVAQLKEQLEKIDGQIAGLKTYVNDELKNAKDWATATFATIDKMNEIAETVATIKTAMESIQETAARHDREIAGLKTDIAKVEENLKAWVNSQLEDYYNIAAVDAKLGELTENYTNADEALREDIRGEISTAKEEITAAYKKYVDDAIKGGGQIGEEIQRQINAFKAELEPRLKSMEDRLDGLEASIAKLEGRVKTLEEQVSDMKTTIGNLQYAYEQADKAIKSLQDIVDELKNTTIPSLEAKIKDYETRIKALEDYKAEIAKKIEDLKKYVDEQTAACLKEAKEYTEAWVKKSLENYNTKEEITKLLADLKTELSGLITAEENARKEADSALEKKLQEQIDALKKTVEELGKIEADLKKWVTDNYYDKTTIDAKLAELKKAYEAADSQLQKNIEAAKEELESTIAKKEEDITKAYQDAIKTAIEEAHGKITKEIADAIATVTADLSQVKTDLTNLTTRVTTAEKAIEDLKDADEKIKESIAALEKQVGEDIAKQVEELKKADKALQEQIAAVIENYKAADATLQSNIDKVSAEADQLKKDVDAANTEIAKIQEDVKKINDSITTLQEKVAELEKKVAANAEAIAKLQDADEKIRESIEQLKNDFGSKLSEEVEKLEKVDEEIKKQINEISAGYKAADETLQDNIDALSTKVDELETALKTKIAEDIQKAVDAIQSKIDAINDRLDALEGRINSMLVIPDYEDGSIKLPFDYNGSTVTPKTFSVSYIVSPAAYAETIVKSLDNIKGYIVETLTKAGTPSTITPTSCTNNNGVITVTFGALNQKYYGFSGDYQPASIAVAVLEKGQAIYTSKFTPLYPCSDAPQTIDVSIYKGDVSNHNFDYMSGYYIQSVESKQLKTYARNYEILKVTTSGAPGKWSIKSYPDWLYVHADEYVSGALMLVYPNSTNNSFDGKEGSIVLVSSTGATKTIPVTQKKSPYQFKVTPSSIPNTGTNSGKVSLESGSESYYQFTSSSSDDWIYDFDNNRDTFKVRANTGAERTGTILVTLYATYSDYYYDNAQYFEISVTQAAADPTLNVDKESLTFDAKGGEKTLKITSKGAEWIITDYPSWVTINTTTGTANTDVKVTAKHGLKDSRTGTITISNYATTKTISISQAASSTFYVSSETVDDGKEITIFSKDSDITVNISQFYYGGTGSKNYSITVKEGTTTKAHNSTLTKNNEHTIKLTKTNYCYKKNTWDEADCYVDFKLGGGPDAETIRVYVNND